MTVSIHQRIKRLFVTRESKTKLASHGIARKRTTFEPLEGRDLLSASPIGGASTSPASKVDAGQMVCVAPAASGGNSDLADWQSNYGAGAAAIGGGVDILIASVGERAPSLPNGQAVDQALLCFVVKPTDSTSSAADSQGRLVFGSEQGIFRSGSTTPGAPNGKLYVATDVGVFVGAANNQGKLIVGVDNVDLNRQSIGGTGRTGGGSSGDDILIGGPTTHDTRGGGSTTVADDVIVDGRIITGENPASSLPGKTIRLRIAAVNNAGK